MLVTAARHHDAGKDRPHWQNGMNARQEGRPYAKTEGGGDPRRLNGYRHEFGTLRDVEPEGLLAGLDGEMRELALHLIASHHGHARPTIAACSATIWMV
jgi:CRISPR-associated endonuclease/helicase Cas3